MNSNPRLLKTLYTSASARYYKLKRRYDKRVQNKTFQQLTKRKQFALINQLKKLYERLKSLHTLLRTAAAGSVIALALSVTEVNAQTLGPFERNDRDNPLPPPLSTIAVPRPVAVDIDNDGDLDVFVGDKYGNIHFFRNNAGPNSLQSLDAETGSNNPFDGVDVGSRAGIAFADVDGDGDFDALIGSYGMGSTGGETFFYRNTGTKENPVFTAQTGASNPFNGITGSVSPTYGRRGSLPSFADIDGDSDIDLIIGSRFIYDEIDDDIPSIHVFKNNAGVFTESDNSAFSALFHIDDPVLTFARLDADSDLDILVGSRFGGSVRAFFNNGTQFIEQTGAWNPTARTGNPASDIYLTSNVAPSFADFDGDGDLDLFIGSGSTYTRPEYTDPVRFYENTDGAFSLTRLDGVNANPFQGVDVGSDARPAFVDIDNDGDIDAILGNKYESQLYVYVNEAGVFRYRPNHPLSDLNVPYGSTPVFIDIDNDGDQDLFVGTTYGISFFENDNGDFTEEDSPIAPSGYEFTIAFVDVDDDGDYDAFVTNNYEGRIDFYRNTGSATNPAFTKATTPAPFNSFDFKYDTLVTAIDFDHDGDRDIIVNETTYDYNAGFLYTAFRFFENEDGNFEELNSSEFFDEITPASDYMNFGDVDGDGDLDILIGHGSDHGVGEDGRISFFENINPEPVTHVSLSSVSVAYNTPVRLDPDLTIEDEDEDDIVLATVEISNYAAGNEELSFTPSAGVTGEFEDGVLTIRGKASLEDYQTILQSVTYEATGDVSAARMSASRAGVPPQPQGKTVTFRVRDIDFTQTIVSVVSVIALNVTGELSGIVVYNAISPGVSTGLNDYMRIEGLPANNKVTILNRWGDKVFEISKYDNDTRRFEGKNDSGKDLPSGTYYYQIESSGKTVTGYLSLKR